MHSVHSHWVSIESLSKHRISHMYITRLYHCVVGSKQWRIPKPLVTFMVVYNPMESVPTDTESVSPAATNAIN